MDPRNVLNALGKITKYIDDRVWARAALKVSEIMMSYIVGSVADDAAGYDATPTVNDWNQGFFGRPPTDPATGKWNITGFNFKTMVKGGATAKVHHVVPKRLIAEMNRLGFNFDVNGVAGAVLTKEEHDLFEKGLKSVIPHGTLTESPGDYLDALNSFYDKHPSPKGKMMAKIVRGFKSKFIR